MTKADIDSMGRVDHAFVYGSDQCVDEDGEVWLAITWHPSTFVLGDDGKEHHVLYHHDSKHVYLDETGTLCRREWSEEDKAHQRSLYDYQGRAASTTIYNGRTWSKLSSIPTDMEGRAKMVTYSSRALTQAMADEAKLEQQEVFASIRALRPQVVLNRI
jgi:hypothetical protein